MARLAVAFNAMIERLQERKEAVQAANEQLQAQSEELTSANEELQSQQEELRQAWEETKRAEEELRRSQGVLAEAERLSHTGAWEWDLTRNQWTFSDEWLAIHGCPKRTLSLEELLPIAHPDDRAEIERAFEDVRNGIRPYSLEHRIIRQDTGEVRIVNAYGQLVRDARDTPLKVLGVTQDITERKQAELERETTVEFLRLANESTATRDLIKAAAGFFQRQSGCEAVGVRLREGNDYPYYEARGFPKEFVLAESSLCARGDAGEIIRDCVGNPVLECMCGNVICRRFDPSKPFFTPGGSFWTNSTTELLSSTTEADRQARTRNRCNGKGYESVALIPLRCKKERCVGLLQLNDRRKGRFTPEMIALWERLAGYLAVALEKFRAEEELLEASQRLQSHVENSPLAVIELAPDYRVIRWSEEAQRIFGWSAEEVLGKRISDLRWVYEEDQKKVAALDADMLSGRRLRNSHVNRNYRKDGSVIECEWYNSALLDASGKLVSMLSLALDITERKRAEERAAALQEITAALSRALTPEDVANLIARQGMRALGADLGFVATLSENGREIEMVRSTNYLQEVPASSWPIPVDAPAPLAEAVREGRLVVIESEEEWYARYPAWAEHNRVQGYTAGVAAPLVVDDNADAAKMLARLLGVEGHEVMEAHSGPAALEVAGSYRPDVVLLDIGMPGMDGYEVAGGLRCLPGLADTPLIALTGYGQDEDRERSRQAGFDHHLTKPVDFHELKRLLARLG